MCVFQCFYSFDDHDMSEVRSSVGSEQGSFTRNDYDSITGLHKITRQPDNLTFFIVRKVIRILQLKIQVKYSISSSLPLSRFGR